MNETYQCDWAYTSTKIDLSKYKIPDKPRAEWTQEEIDRHDLWCRLMADEIKYRQFTGTGFSLYPPMYALQSNYPPACFPVIPIR